MPKHDRRSWNHVHDGLRTHSKILKHELVGIKNDPNADIRGTQYYHEVRPPHKRPFVNGVLPESPIDKVTNLGSEIEQPEISFGTFPDWHEHAYKRANDSIKEIISLLLKKSELQIRIGETENSLRNDQEALAEVTRGITRVEIPS